MVGAAIIGGAVIGGAATLGASSMASDATSSASNAAIQQQQSALNQQATLSAPYRQLGSDAIGQYEALLGIGPQPQAGAAPGGGSFAWEGGGAPGTIGGLGLNGPNLLPGPGGQPTPSAPSSTSMMDALSKTPGYQFALDQGQKGVLNAASMGGGVGGNTLADLTKFNQGLASTTYQQQVDNLGRAVGSGQAAAAGQAQNVGGAADNISSALINQGNTTAGIDANTAAALSKIGSNSIDQYQTNQTLKALTAQNYGSGGPDDLTGG